MKTNVFQQIYNLLRIEKSLWIHELNLMAKTTFIELMDQIPFVIIPSFSKTSVIKRYYFNAFTGSKNDYMDIIYEEAAVIHVYIQATSNQLCRFFDHYKQNTSEDRALFLSLAGVIQTT